MPLDPYQSDGAEFLAARPVAYLADVMGLGKTAQLVRALDMVQARTVTWLCPAVLRTNTAREYEKFSAVGLPVTIIASGADEIPADGVVIVSYPLAARPEVLKRLVKRRADVLVCDEAHYLKTASSERTKAVLSAKGLGRTSARVWFASATPAPNNAGELYPFCAAAGLAGRSQGAFVREHCITRNDGFKDIPIATRDPERLRAMLAPVMLRRTFESVGYELPELLTEVAEVEGKLPALSTDVLRSIERALAADDWNMGDTPEMATARRAIGLAKLESAKAYIRHALETSGKVVAFAVHREVIEALREEFGALVIHGGVSAVDRQEAVDGFQSDPNKRLIICQIHAAGVGLTLTAASRVVMVEYSWSPADNAQAIARCHRRGQSQPVLATYLVLSGSIDGAILRVSSRKFSDVARFVTT